MADKKPISFITALIIVACALAGYSFWVSLKSTTDSHPAESHVTAEADGSVSAEETAVSVDSAIDVKAALSERILGDTNAPIKMSEHSSLTCGHCGTFHKGTFKQFKEAFVDTGKVYIVFSDFPLNAPALHASMTARCLPHDKYFDFIQMLFEKQDEWAYESNYMKYLQQKAFENGLSKDGFRACIASKELQEGITARQRASQTQWNINSTPSFVLNNKTTLSGGRPFDEFKILINEELAKLEGSAP